jgi:hypothetical protein
MTIELPEDLERSVQAEVLSGHFATADDMVAEIVRRYFLQRGQCPPEPERQPAGEGLPSVSHKPVWERILERTAAVPDEEWDRLPADLAEQHDHYLYGVPKRPTP